MSYVRNIIQKNFNGLPWLKLVGIAGATGASLTHRWVQVIPGLTNFKGGHMFFMFTMDTTFFQSKLLSAYSDICHLCQFTPLHA